MLSSSSSYFPANVAPGSLADLSATSGNYLLFAPLGEVHVSALDLTRFDRGEASATLAYAESAITLDPFIRPTVPSVIALHPDNGASGVDPATRISITFSEPIDRSSITAATGPGRGQFSKNQKTG